MQSFIPLWDTGFRHQILICVYMCICHGMQTNHSNMKSDIWLYRLISCHGHDCTYTLIWSIYYRLYNSFICPICIYSHVQTGNCMSIYYVIATKAISCLPTNFVCSFLASGKLRKNGHNKLVCCGITSYIYIFANHTYFLLSYFLRGNARYWICCW